MIKYDRKTCNDYESASACEWLEANGIGGFASGTISGANTRRYHGLLTAATTPPLGRATMLSKYEECIEIDGTRYELSTNKYPGAIHPKGFQYLASFRLDPFPVWLYEINGIEIERSVFMVHGQNTTVCKWATKGAEGSEIALELRPLLSFSDYHALQHEDEAFSGEYTSSGNLASLRPYPSMPPLYLCHNAGSIEKTGHWYRHFEYEIEKERGFDFREDLFQPFLLRFDLKEEAFAIASTEKQIISDVMSFEMREVARREALILQAEAKSSFKKQLVLAADQFIVKRGDGKTIIAGYPWFSDWGRDTMISLPGLALATNREEIAKGILLEFSKHISQGMIPNRFPDAGDEAEYNTVDATLWFFEAARAYAAKTKDYDFIRQNLYEKLVEIIAWHVHGTRYNIQLDEDGLLGAGSPDTQLTWMDAKIGDWAITPRHGKAVEIQALWYNALCIMADFSRKFGEMADKQQYEAMAKQTKASFNKLFWNKSADCLYDIVNAEGPDPSIRPNQIFAVSLPHTMLSIGKAKKVVEKVEAELLTPFGLRSLSPRDKNYCPEYSGPPLKRDSAYHQGTAWGWLIGPFIDALRRVSPKGNHIEKKVAELLAGLEAHLMDTGIGQFSEIFDAAPPHHPRGCPAQAWSIAETLRVLK